MTTATAITACTALEIERGEMVRVRHEEHSFSDLFLRFLPVRSMRTQADLVDQLFNSSEKRLARILLLLAEFGKPGEPEVLNSLENLTSRCRHQARLHPGCVNEVLATVEPHHQGNRPPD